MPKRVGTTQITPNPGSDSMSAHFEVSFVPYSPRVNTTETMPVADLDDLVEFLISIEPSEDDASQWAGLVRCLDFWARNARTSCSRKMGCCSERPRWRGCCWVRQARGGAPREWRNIWSRRRISTQVL